MRTTNFSSTYIGFHPNFANFAAVIPVERHIQFLITCHDCVIIPGWGALIAHRIPARIDSAASLLYPPSAIVVFNPSINHDDAMIATSVARTEGWTPEAASREVAEYASSLRRRIEAEGSVALPRIGTFRLSPDHTILFDPDAEGVANAAFCGLPEIALQPLEQAAEAESEAPQISLARRTTTLGKRVIRVAASVAVLLGLGLTLSTPISSTFYEGVDFAGIGITSRPAATAADEEGNFVPSADPAGARIILAQPDPALASAPLTTSRPMALTDDPRHPVKGHDYYLIVASLESRQKAENYLRRHQSENLALIEGNGHYRIFAASGTSIADASKAMKDEAFRSAHPDAWVYRVR